MFLSRKDMRVAATLTPEVLPAIRGTDYAGRFAEISRDLITRAKEMIRSIEYYSPRVTDRTQMWNVIKLIQQKHNELDEYIQALRKVEEKWEEEEFQEQERQWQQRQRKF
jgi:hypothetical protein